MNKKNIILITTIIIVFLVVTIFFIKNPRTKNQTNNSIIENLFPSLQTNNQDINKQTGSDNQKNQNSNQKPSTKKTINQEIIEPVVSMAVLPNTIASSSIVYMKKNDGHIYIHKQQTDSKDDILISNNTIPFTQKAFFAFIGTEIHIIAFYNKNQVLQNKYLVIDSTQPTLLPKEVILENDIVDVVESPNLNSFLLIQNINNQVVAINFDPKTNSRTRVYGFPQFDWKFNWFNKQLITLQTKPSANLFGFLYRFTATENGLEKIIDKTLELSTLMNSVGDYLLFSGDIGGSLNTKLKNLTSKQILPLPFTTIPDKCVFDRQVIVCQKINKDLKAGDLDKWYKGQTSLAGGGFWEYGIETEEFYELATISSKIDATDLKIDSSNYIIYFKNKLDNSIWSLDLGLARY